MSIGTDALTAYQNAPVIVPHATNVPPGKFDKKLFSAAQDFESIFIKQMLDSMRQTVDQSGLLDGGVGRDIYEDMLYQQYAQQMSKTANLGIARMIYNQLSGSEGT